MTPRGDHAMTNKVRILCDATLRQSIEQ